MQQVLKLAAALALAVPGAAVAQDANPAAIAAQKAAMAKLDWMRGTWRGPAVAKTAQGDQRITQTERIGSFLDGTLIVMEGRGFRDDGSTGFNAFGVLSYDANAKAYQLRSYALGYAGTFTLTPNDTGYVWEIPAGPTMTIRYTANFHDGVWTEVGDRILPGQAPQRFFEMNLRRTGETDWPGAGALKVD